MGLNIKLYINMNIDKIRQWKFCTTCPFFEKCNKKELYRPGKNTRLLYVLNKLYLRIKRIKYIFS